MTPALDILNRYAPAIRDLLDLTSFQTRGPDGVVDQVSVAPCHLPVSEISPEYESDQTYGGELQIEVEDPAGALVLVPRVPGASGWEWPYGTG
ncbi:hypothetical protein [Amycolatopsis sp. NPDC051903]|uniref:hypothetical protein n=1 Tax=Amycolatopsis sp. NPDC051903 TaxID=3363936 RepID=UPI0037B60853